MDYTDRPVDIRAGESLDNKKLEQYLKDTIPGFTEPLTIKQFPGGHSNLTYLLTTKDREMVLRRPPFGTKAKTAHDMAREYKILKALKPVFPYVPTPLVYNDDSLIMDCPFYVMERINGIILRKEIPRGLNLSKTQIRRLFEKHVEIQCELHSLDYKKIGLEDFGKPQGYVKRQVKGWTNRYKNAKTPDAPEFDNIIEWLNKNMPQESPVSSIIHNDFKFDNLVLDKDNPLSIIGVLDWEMATIGDPLMDIGCTLGYWVEKNDPPEFQAMRTLPTHIDGAMTRSEIISYYEKISGFTIDNMDFYHCFGLFRLAVIAQQIYFRYYQGQTQDKRFKNLIYAVQALKKAADNLI